ncbi:carboxypeptidase regulatory-like domain-containing protein [Halanaerobiaceae bacterium Z-7014]|uniref:Carboxypeptidase regulatory-like domain-containing protein n=1 Tax=Halonatronomonas betaini TaxID=2778430 RepID=A0A931F711_9FIRM|nr:carboxypeptidase-like regulatory domain-containing protein [Halonatronomonas betaini]MBF8437500.1 carboxypeptidase regulatory-like domain-containing protein [Halonatronomonas betaini]
MKFDRTKFAGLVALALVMIVALGACDSAGPAAEDSRLKYDVTVLVLDEQDQALQGAEVTLGQLEKSTDNDGLAEFEEVAEATYELDVEITGYTASSEDTGTVTVDQDSTEFTVVMVEGDSDSGDTGQDDSDDSNDSDQDDDDDSQDGDDSQDDDDSKDGSRSGDTESDFTWADDEDSVIARQFAAAESKQIDLGQLADGESAIVAISPLNIDPDSSAIYDGSLEVTYSDGSQSSQSTAETLSSSSQDGSQSSAQAELDSELRELEDQLLDQDLQPAADTRADVTAQDAYEIGDSRAFYNKDNEKIDATLKAIGDEVLIYLEDGYQLETETLEEMAAAYDDNIYPTVMDHFGFHAKTEYDWDGNGRTIIFIEDMGGSSQNGMIMGYFHSKDYFSNNELNDKYISNEADMFYINYQAVKEAESRTGFTMDNVLQTVAHEFQHLVFFVNKRNAGRKGTDTWINEGFSMLAEYLTGYRDYNGDLRINSFYFSEPEQTSTMYWDQNSSDYGASALIGYYLYEKLGSGIIEDIQTSSNPASQVISDKYIDFPGLMLGWMLSNYIDGENLDKFSYSGFDLDARPALAATIDGSFSGSFSVKSTAVKYFKIEGTGAEVSLQVDNLNEDTGIIIFND